MVVQTYDYIFWTCMDGDAYNMLCDIGFGNCILYSSSQKLLKLVSFNHHNDISLSLSWVTQYAFLPMVSNYSTDLL